MKLKERIISQEYRRQMEALGGIHYARSVRWFQSEARNGEEAVRAFLSRQYIGKMPDGSDDMRWHISVSVVGQTRLPTWDELKLVRRALKPNVFFCIAFPPERYWMNYGEVLHLSETKDGNAIDQWKMEGEQARKDRDRGIGYGVTLEDAVQKRGSA